MPTLEVSKTRLYKAIGKTLEYSDDQFKELCFDFGLEVEEIFQKACGNSHETWIKLDIPANRYDLLCLEGLALALNVYLNKPFPQIIKQKAKYTLTVGPNTKKVRPFVVSCILRDITFTQESFDSFIALQDHLHRNIGRRRTLVAIGTHDLDKIKGPFFYDALSPKDIEFLPLQPRTSNLENAAIPVGVNLKGDQLAEFYKNDNNISPYVPIIVDSPVYPVIMDSSKKILSLPPIINSECSKMTVNTKNVFIESTATDLTKATIVLNTIISAFSIYCKVPFSVEAVDVVYPAGSSESKIAGGEFPRLHSGKIISSVEYINRLIGLNLDGPTMASLLNKMMVPTKFVRVDPKLIGGQAVQNSSPTYVDGKTVDNSKADLTTIPALESTIAITRSDLFHACDIAEDVAVAYGFNSVPVKIPTTNTIGRQQPINRLTDNIRIQLAMCGFSECLTFGLTSWEDAYTNLNIKIDLSQACVLDKPKTEQFKIVRPSLLGGILRSYFSNHLVSHASRLFEVSDVVQQSSDSDTGAKNQRRVCICTVSTEDNMALLHGTIDKVFQKLGFPNGPNSPYKLVACNTNSTFLPGRCAKIMFNNKELGYMGVLHPSVNAAFRIKSPVCAAEFSIEDLVNTVS